MIGNDIIDLSIATTQSNWRRKGYLEKIFHESERLMILESEDPDLMVWILFSMKEAAYKIYSRANKIRAYIPGKFICSEICFNETIITGLVHCEENIYHTNSKISGSRLHTIAVVEIA